jgi:periplasmic copper chaperone A
MRRRESITVWPRALTAIAVVFALLGSCAAEAAGAIGVSQPWFRYLLPAIPAAGYLTLHNAANRPAVLTGAHSPACAMLMLHRTISAGGTEGMIGVKSVTVPAQGSFRFAPGGYHLMCMHPHMHPGESVPVTLMFGDGSRLVASFPVHGAKR